MQQTREKKISLQDIILVGLMAAIVFAVTFFLNIKIPTPTGTTMIKLANAFCLIIPILFGSWRGGLAAGLGSMFYDFTNPEYVPEAWITFVRFFLVAYLCGKIAYARGARGQRTGQNLLAAVAASLFSVLFYMAKNIIVLLLAGSYFIPALAATSIKAGTSLINAVIAVVLCMALTPALSRALDRAGLGLVHQTRNLK